ncbi:serine hydrolase domain-containing protein [Paenibacillus spongiae]|uniref:Beta-lactamase family protein n=1 Tax=Paenibacillus spongiae TaxID=2909671 RepID=A0ABY5SIF2_9BACL|nr:serine hydrolase domain-containing protein [Paenibacillus spongiae]UVI33791.1 beta-lactamase family protein [Paenibacillus spongiae]
MHDVMAGYIERGEVPGIVTLISRKGEVHVEAYGMKALGGSSPMSRDTLFRIASMTKPITAAAAMILVEEGKLQLDEPVDRLLPELAGRRVLKRLEGPIDDMVPANRPITLLDLLTFRLGIGIVMAPPGQYPIQRKMADLGLEPGPTPPVHEPDEWIRRLGSLPLIHQPGEAWMYHTGSDVLGILIARAAGQSLEHVFRSRIFDPLGMGDTGFHVPAGKLARLPASYMTSPDPSQGTLMVHDDPEVGRWSRPPAFPSGGGGLVSTADDYLAFCRMMLNGGRQGSGHILSRSSVELMTTNHLTPKQIEGACDFLGVNRGWGFGVSVSIGQDHLTSKPGRFGWDGGIGTSGFSDPNEDLVGILMTQRLMDSPEPPGVFQDFWTSVYQAIEAGD